MSLRSNINKDIYKSNRQHYLKWDLPIEHTSIRFYFVTGASNMNNYRKFMLKNHETKNITLLTRQEALRYISISGVADTKKEIVSHFVSTRNAYVKYEITDNSITEVLEVVRDKEFSRTRLYPSLLTKLVNYLIKELL